MVKVVRIPEEQYGRLHEMAKRRGVSVNQLMGELTISTQSEAEAKRQFRVSAVRGLAHRSQDDSSTYGDQ